jgi:hypothetical protein
MTKARDMRKRDMRLDWQIKNNPAVFAALYPNLAALSLQETTSG